METQRRAVIWDVDGTLIDSAEYHFQTWRDALQTVNFALTRALFDTTFGQRNDAVLRSYFGSDFAISEIKRLGDAKEARYREVVRDKGIEPLPGVRRWLELLDQQGWRQVIASSANPLNIAAILDALDFHRYFPAYASAESVERGKPDPQIFLAAAALVKTPPARCIVVEDAPAGVEGARRARMRSIGVLTTHTRLEADLVVKSLDDLPDDAFIKLLGETN